MMTSLKGLSAGSDLQPLDWFQLGGPPVRCLRGHLYCGKQDDTVRVLLLPLFSFPSICLRYITVARTAHHDDRCHDKPSALASPCRRIRQLRCQRHPHASKRSAERKEHPVLLQRDPRIMPCKRNHACSPSYCISPYMLCRRRVRIISSI